MYDLLGPAPPCNSRYLDPISPHIEGSMQDVRTRNIHVVRVFTPFAGWLSVINVGQKSHHRGGCSWRVREQHAGACTVTATCDTRHSVHAFFTILPPMCLLVAFTDSLCHAWLVFSGDECVSEACKLAHAACMHRACTVHARVGGSYEY